MILKTKVKNWTKAVERNCYVWWCTGSLDFYTNKLTIDAPRQQNMIQTLLIWVFRWLGPEYKIFVLWNITSIVSSAFSNDHGRATLLAIVTLVPTSW